MAKVYSSHYYRSAKGYRRPTVKKVQISVSFDPDTFERIVSYQPRKGASFSEKVRDLVEFGLEALDLGGDDDL